MYTLSSALPSLALFLALAVMPLLLPKLWYCIENAVLIIIGLWVIAVVVRVEGGGGASHTIVHMLMHEYIAFIAIIFALFIVAGGIHIQFNLSDSLKNNLLILLFGALLANFIGTTGASMVLIRPFLHLNHNRPYQTHLGVFFIFIVANIGGSLTPLGDPPLFLGYLEGVDFAWNMQHGWLPLAITLIYCLTIFAVIDRLKNKHHVSQRYNIGIQIEGWMNIGLMLVIVAITMLAPMLSTDPVLTIMGIKLSWQDLMRDLGYLCIGVISLLLTPKHIHLAQHFNFAPFKEIAKVFLVIFLTLIPLSAMLKLGTAGPFNELFNFSQANGLPIDTRYFWLTGGLSAILDNAPTYLLFFKMAGGNAQTLMQQMPSTLLAISLGAVYMGAMTYIGNAPNFMVRNIAKQSGIAMPSFMGYIAWSLLVLLPIFYIISLYLKYF